ncbi:hypothetical protein VS883_28755, partial [Escherichia coli]
ILLGEYFRDQFLRISRPGLRQQKMFAVAVYESCQFLPRILLGEYFRDQFLRISRPGLRQQKMFAVAVYES